jgi:hypothetical protein
VILDLKLEKRGGLFTSVVEIPDGFSVVDGFLLIRLRARMGVTVGSFLVPTFVAFRASSGSVVLTRRASRRPRS